MEKTRHPFQLPRRCVYKGASLSDTDYAINVDTTSCYASYRKGTPYTVTVKNGDLTGPGVPNKKGSGMFLVGDTVNITPYEKKSNDEMLIPFQKWTSSDVEITNPTSPSNSFTVPGQECHRNGDAQPVCRSAGVQKNGRLKRYDCVPNGGKTGWLG